MRPPRGRPATDTAVRAGDHVLAADQLCIANDALGDELRVLDDVAGVTDDTGNQYLAVGQLRVLEDGPLPLVTGIRSFD